MDCNQEIPFTPEWYAKLLECTQEYYYPRLYLSRKDITMPLIKKGSKIKSAMVKEYGKKRGEQVFYASENKGTIKGVAKKKK